MKSRSCPSCLSNQYNILHKQKFSGGVVHNIVSCRACGFVFVRNVLSQSEFNNLYSQASIYEFTRDEDIHEKSFRMIKKYISKNSSILDIGCSTGNLLGLFKRHGYRNVLGIDPSANCKHIAWKNYRIKVRTGTLETIKSKEKYDLVIMSNVLEHLANIRSSIRKCKELLKPTGYLYIAVPDADSFYKNVNEPFYEFSLEHINFFSISSLRKTLLHFDELIINSDGKVIYSIWKNGDRTLNAIKKYIELSNKKMTTLKKFVNNLPNEYVVWGAGALARRLLATTSLHPKYFIDRNNKLYGSKVSNIPIINPSEVKKYSYPVLIMSYRFKKEIKRHMSNYFKEIIELP